MLSVITPAFNEGENLLQLYERLRETLDAVAADWEWVVVDDHSRDDTFEVISRLSVRDPRVRGIRLARNSGSHLAITCGLHHVRGSAAVMMAGDLQDPPETLRTMLERWQRGAQIVWAVRRTRPGEGSHLAFAAFYYWVMRRVVGLHELPRNGVDFFLIDREVIEAFKQHRERNMSIFALLVSLGFRQEFVEYDKQKRAAGKSGWTLARKIKLVVDSIVGFSDAPIRACSGLGVVLMAVAFLIFVASLFFLPSLGAGLLFVLAAMFGLTGLQLLALGMVGEYVWRAFDEARGRPQYLIEATTTAAAASPIEKL